MTRMMNEGIKTSQSCTEMFAAYSAALAALPLMKVEETLATG
jgi:hypothetical protein